MSAAAALLEGLRGRGRRVVYVRDTVSAFWWATALGPALAVPVVYEAHDLESPTLRGPASPGRKACVRELDRGALGESTLVVSLTEDFRRLLAERGLGGADEVVVIPDAFDDGRVRRRPRGGARGPRLSTGGARSWSTRA